MLARARVICAVVWGLLAGAYAGASAPLHSVPTAPYLQALRVADMFLAAWAQRDPDAGLALLSPGVLARDPDSSRADLRGGLRQYMTGLSNPHHEAFEIGAGNPVGPDRLSFPVRLFEIYLGESTGMTYSDTLEVVRHGDEWRVDRLPRAYDPD